MTEKDLQTLFSRQERPNKSILSIYLNVDQSNQSNLNRGFETHLKTMNSSLRYKIRGAAEMERFQNAAHHIEDFVSAFGPGARAIALFFDATDGFFWHQEMDAPVENQVRWDRELFLQPLAAALDESERFGVVLLDHAHRRVFSVFLGEITEYPRNGFDPRKVRHIKTVGTDHLGSASRVQHKADEQIRTNLRKVAEDVDWLVKTQRVHFLVLAGRSEVTSELREMLPKRLALLVAGAIDLAIDSSPKDVLGAVSVVNEQHERDTEIQMVKEVVTAAAKKQKAVAGLSHTLNAVNQGRVWQLIYADGLASPGFECRECARLTTVQRRTCHYCGGKIQPVKDVIERAVEHGLRQGARIEVVKGNASATLKLSGGIGAFLKARTASLQS